MTEPDVPIPAAIPETSTEQRLLQRSEGIPMLNFFYVLLFVQDAA